MKKIFVILMIAINCLLIGCSSENVMSKLKRNTEWDMSQEDVKKIEDNNLKSEEDYQIIDSTCIAYTNMDYFEEKVTILYAFEDNKLNKILITFDENTDYQKINDEIEKILGDATFDVSEDTYQCTQWEKEDNEITLIHINNEMKIIIEKEDISQESEDQENIKQYEPLSQTDKSKIELMTDGYFKSMLSEDKYGIDISQSDDTGKVNIIIFIKTDTTVNDFKLMGNDDYEKIYNAQVIAAETIYNEIIDEFYQYDFVVYIGLLDKYSSERLLGIDNTGRVYDEVR